MVFGGRRDIFDLLAEFSPQNFGASFSGRADEADRKSWFVRHRKQRGLSISRQPFDANLFCVDVLVGLEIIQCAARSPRPSAKCAPIVQLSRLAFVHEPDDSLRKAFAII